MKTNENGSSRREHGMAESAAILGRSEGEVAGSRGEPGSWAVPERWRWHHAALLDVQGRIETVLSGHRLTAAGPVETHSLSEADSATDEWDHALAAGGLSAGQDVLMEVLAALARIRDGTYGRCEASGRTIPEERLRAIPWTRFTLEEEARLEKSGAVTAEGIGEARSLRPRGRVRLAGGPVAGAGGNAANEGDAGPPAADETITTVPEPGNGS